MALSMTPDQQLAGLLYGAMKRAAILPNASWRDPDGAIRPIPLPGAVSTPPTSGPPGAVSTPGVAPPPVRLGGVTPIPLRSIFPPLSTPPFSTGGVPIGPRSTRVPAHPLARIAAMRALAVA